MLEKIHLYSQPRTIINERRNDLQVVWYKRWYWYGYRYMYCTCKWDMDMLSLYRANMLLYTWIIWPSTERGFCRQKGFGRQVDCGLVFYVAIATFCSIGFLLLLQGCKSYVDTLSWEKKWYLMLGVVVGAMRRGAMFLLSLHLFFLFFILTHRAEWNWVQ